MITPFETATLKVVYWNGLFCVNRLIDLIFLVDMVMCFVTAYRAKQADGGALVKNLRMIRINYLKSWFLLDLLSVIPWEILQDLDFGNGEYFATFKFVRLIRILRMLKLLRIIKATRLYSHYESTLSWSYAYISLLKYSCILIFVGHWMACMWIMTAAMQDDTTHTWLDASKRGGPSQNRSF